MSRFNESTKGINTTVNHEGAVAYKMNSEMELYTLVCTFAMQDKFYESASEQMKRLRDLITKVSPVFVAKLAVYAREQMYLRTVPIILTVELAKFHKGDDLVSRMVKKVLQRADEIGELLSYYQIANDRTGTKKLDKVSNQIKNGIREVFEAGKFNEYQFAKYNRSTDVRLRDALFLTHPKPQSDEQKSLFDKIAADTLETPYTWEVQLSELGKKDSSIEAKRTLWEELIDSEKLGFMALLRNLRNIIKVEVSQEHINKVCDTLSNPELVRKSKQFPFRFLSAYRSLIGPYERFGSNTESDLNKRYVNLVIEALEKAVLVSAEQVPSFENAIFATDVSGSMQQLVSPKSVIQMYDIGTVLCMMTYLHSKGSVTGMFGDTWEVFNFPKKNILRNANEVHQLEGRVGYATNFHRVIEWALRQSENYDYLFAFTDTQMWDTDDVYYSKRTNEVVSKWNLYKKKNPKAKLILMDMGGYSTTPIDIKNNDIYLVSGWSDRVLSILKQLMEGDSVLNEINRIEI